MARHLPSLNALKAFEAAARNASFTLAAAELNVTHAAVSRHIRELEAWLGAKLFVRTGRGVELTERGKGYVTDVTRGFDLLAAATESVSRRRRRRQELVVSIEVALASLWLVPRLGSFTAAHPELDLVIDASDRLVDFSRNEADVGVRYGRGKWNGVASELLTGTHMTPACAPALLKRTAVREPADLAPNLLLQEETRQFWRGWLEAAGVAGRIEPQGAAMSSLLTIPAAEAGQGFALVDEVIAADALMAGRLVRPFAISVENFGYYLVRGADRKETKAMAAFRLWVKMEIARTAEAVCRLPLGPAPLPKKRKAAR
jgi:LysR family glycine cleavage system transcriptional activator